MVRDCKGCGRPFDTAGKAKFCADVGCRRERDRVRKRRQPGVVVAIPVAKSRVLGSADPKVARSETVDSETSNFPTSSGDGPTVRSATFEALTSANRLDTPAGQLAMVLAERLSSASSDTGSSLAALAKQHLAVLAEALKGAPRQKTRLDELREEKERRRSG